MEFLPNGYTLDLPEGCFPLSTDSMVLADFVRLGREGKVLDLGSGCATLGLLLCSSESHRHITGIELDQTAHAAAVENIRRNGLQPYMTSICADLRSVNQLVPAGSFRYCISNPPYFSGGPASRSNPLARRDDCCGTEDLFDAAAWALRYGGDFYLVHKPERLAQLCACAVQKGLEPKRLRLVRHRTDGPVTLILLQCRKGGKPGLILEEEALFDASNQPTAYHNNVYHLP